MAALKISRKEKWENAHKILHSSLSSEIRSMREVLASLHQEELALLHGEESRWAQVMQERSELVVTLANQREVRMQATTELTKCAISLGKKELLPHSEESSCSILSKLDQHTALLERINLQNCRNEALFYQKKQKKGAPLVCTYPHPLHRVRKKVRVATYAQKR
jgi:hypothetical protein